MNKVQFKIIIFSILFSTVIAVVFPSSSSNEEISIEYIKRLFKEERYREIIELSYGLDFSGFNRKLILARSYEKLGYINRSYKIYREAYKSEDMFSVFSYFLIANMFFNAHNMAESLDWFNRFFREYERRDRIIFAVDWEILINYSLSMVYEIFNVCKDNSRITNRVIKTIKIIKNVFPLSNYYLFLIMTDLGKYVEGVEYLNKFFTAEGFDNYKNKVLRVVMDNDKILKLLLEDESWKNIIVKRLMIYGLYSEVLQLGITFPDFVDEETKAFCYMKLQDYKSSVIYYNNVYHRTRNPEIILKIATSYFFQKKYKKTNYYLKKYRRLADKKNSNLSFEYLKIKVELGMVQNDVDLVVRYCEILTKNYALFYNIDSLIYDVFYYLLGEGEIQRGVNILENYYPFIKGKRYISWASYILGLFRDKTYFYHAVVNYPGSYYYFRARNYINLNSKAIKKADNLFKNKNFKQALEIYIGLYSMGIKSDYVKDRIIDIMHGIKPYEYFYRAVSETHLTSFLFRMCYLGFFDILQDILNFSINYTANYSRIFSYILYSNMYIAMGNNIKALYYIESVTNSLEYKLFLPDKLLKIMFPVLFYNEIKSVLERRGWFVDICFTLSVIREESRYNPGAVSNKGAVGLMQLMPDTARWLAKKRITKKMLLDPELNIEIGIIYLERLFNKYRTVEFVLAAYNGGPTNVRRWIKGFYDDDNEKFVELIPFNETRNFVKKVYTTYEFYRFLYKNRCF